MLIVFQLLIKNIGRVISMSATVNVSQECVLMDPTILAVVPGPGIKPIGQPGLFLKEIVSSPFYNQDHNTRSVKLSQLNPNTNRVLRLLRHPSGIMKVYGFLPIQHAVVQKSWKGEPELYMCTNKNDKIMYDIILLLSSNLRTSRANEILQLSTMGIEAIFEVEHACQVLQDHSILCYCNSLKRQNCCRAISHFVSLYDTINSNTKMLNTVLNFHPSIPAHTIRLSIQDFDDFYQHKTNSNFNFYSMEIEPFFRARKDIYVSLLFNESIVSNLDTAITQIEFSVNLLPLHVFVEYILRHLAVLFQDYKDEKDNNLPESDDESSSSGDPQPGSRCSQPEALRQELDHVARAKQHDAETSERNKRNQESHTRSENACVPTSGHPTLDSASSVDANAAERRAEVDANAAERRAEEGSVDEKLSRDDENHSDIPASHDDSESEPERCAHVAHQKRKSNYHPIHREEHYMPFRWEHSDDESPYAPGSHASASSRNKSSQISSYIMSPAQNKSQERRENVTDTSSEGSHWSVDVH